MAYTVQVDPRQVRREIYLITVETISNRTGRRLPPQDRSWIYCSGCNKKECEQQPFVKFKMCSRCRVPPYYCSRQCQKIDWNRRHRLQCEPINNN